MRLQDGLRNSRSLPHRLRVLRRPAARWQAKTPQRRRNREALFRQLEAEAQTYEAQLAQMSSSASVSAAGDVKREASSRR